MGKYAPKINPENNVVEFPPIRQDYNETFERNYVQTFDEINTMLVNQPLLLLLIGNNSPDEIVFPPHDITDFYFDQNLIRDMAEHIDKVPTDVAANRKDTTYGNTTLVHLTDPRSGSNKHLYEHNQQQSKMLSRIYMHLPIFNKFR